MVQESRRVRHFLAVAVLLMLFPGVQGAAGAPEADFTALLQQRLDAEGEVVVASEPIVERSMLAQLYRKAGYRPLWEHQENVATLLQWIERSREEGLKPDDYHWKVLRELETARPSSAAAQVERELLLTDALLLLGMHLSTGKTDAAELYKEWNYEVDYTGAASAQAILGHLDQVSLGRLLEEQLPDGEIYQGLRQALERLRSLQARGGWPAVPEGPTLHPGDRSPRVEILRRRLLASGDLDSSSGDPQLYDDAVAEAVTRFQKRHLLEADGLVGKGTLEALNVSVASRIEQVRVNLERLRWVSHGIPDTFYGVDLAGFILFRGEEWTSPVQVGDAYNQTPVFHDLIRIVEINPTWTVPMSITRRELAPELLQDPLGYLERKNMELLQAADGTPVDPVTVDWSSISAERFPYVLRQRPGPDNALGRIKFLFPNEYAVYLHDTPSKALFSRIRRAFSHGCIRVGKPLELAEQLLRPNGPEWTQRRIQEVIDSGETQRIRLEQPVPVLILYLTAVADGEGVGGLVEFRPDIYGRDQRVLEALNGPVKEKGGKLLAGYREQRGQEW